MRRTIYIAKYITFSIKINISFIISGKVFDTFELLN